MEKWIDSHCHYESKKFDKIRENVLINVKEKCDRVICVGTNIPENKRIIKLSNDYDFIYNMIGFFPTYVYLLDEEICEESKKNIETLKEQLGSKKNVGLGEIGLDYSWDCVGDIKGNKARLLQQKWFKNQIEIAKEMNKPISIHSRDAEIDTIKILKSYNKLSGVFHCFSYTPTTANICLQKGLYLAFGGTSTYKNNDLIRQSIKICPLNRIVLETDAPYLSPEPVRRSINDSTNIKYVIELISKLKNISEEDVIKYTNENCYNLFFKK